MAASTGSILNDCFTSNDCFMYTDCFNGDFNVVSARERWLIRMCDTFTCISPPSKTVISDRDPPIVTHTTPISTTEDIWSNLKSLRCDHATNLILGFLNINSIRNKFMCLEEIFTKNYVDIFSIVESKLDESFPDVQFSCPGFSLLRQDCRKNSGGLMTYIRSDIPHHRRDDVEINSDVFQCLCVELSINGEKWLVSTLYRPPSSPVHGYYEALYLLTDRMLKDADTIILMGDTNINFLNETLASSVRDYLSSFSLSQLIKTATCFKGCPSLLDHVYTNKPRRFTSVVNYDCGLSDFHNCIAVSTKLTCPKRPTQVKYYRSYKHFDESSFLRDISYIPFQVMDIFSDINDSYWAFDVLIKEIIDEHIPLKKKFINHTNAPFMNSALRKSMYRKRQARNKARKNPKNCHLWEDYRQKRNEFVSIRRESIKNYFKERCTGPQNKNLWSTLKPFFSNKSRSSECVSLIENDVLINNESDIASIFNDYFSSITDDIGITEDLSNCTIQDIIHHYSEHPSIIKIKEHYVKRDFTVECVTMTDVQKELKSLNPRKATGHDLFPPRILKICAPVLCHVITDLVNKIICNTSFPDHFKRAEISPVFKCENRLDKRKFRPVSILVCVSTVTERLITKKLNSFVNEIFCDSISAYRKSFNTQSVVLKAVEDWKASLDKNLFVSAISTDLSKAFDVIPHGLLIAKLSAYGCNFSTLSSVYDYLSNRLQRVKINNCRSNWSLIKKGVPQGSVLGPILFNIFINDIFMFVEKCNIYNYADDNLLSCTSNSLESLKLYLEKDVKNLLAWFECNGMKANPDKFQLISFGVKNNLNDISIGQTVIQSQSVIKYLGVHVDDKLSFNAHVTEICKKSGRQASALMRLCNLLDYDTKLLLYKSFISSNFEYCPLVWSFCNKVDYNKVLKIQCRALRFVCKNFVDNFETLLNECNVLGVNHVNFLKLIIEMYKCLKNLSPRFLCSLFEFKSTDYNFRKSKLLDLKRPRSTKYGKNSFTFYGVQVWNSLPNYMKNAENLDDLKKFLHNFKDFKVKMF